MPLNGSRRIVFILATWVLVALAVYLVADAIVIASLLLLNPGTHIMP